MENLILKSTESTPLIDFNLTNNLLRIKGESYPENPAEFYLPILEWLENYLKQLSQPSTIEFLIEYLNSSSCIAFIRLMELFDKYFQDGKNLTINWYYHPENEMSLEYGQLFQSDLKIPFNIKEV